MRFLAAAIALLAFAGPALARTPIEAAYADGAFLEAAALGEQAGAPADLALAAQALLAEAVTSPDADVGALVARAEADARRALAADPRSVNARLQLAIALGMKGRRASVAEALRRGYAREGRALLAEATARAPREAWGHALTGGWNLEIVRRGGAAGAHFYGARVDAGIAAFERARTLAPDDAGIAYQYAVALLELDGRRYAPRAATLLSAAGACGAGDAFEAAMRRDARRIGAVLATRGPEAAAAAATRRFRASPAA